MASIASTAGRLILRLPSACRRSSVPVFLPRYRYFSTTSTAQEKRYTADHEWIDLPRGNTIGIVGISRYAAHALGDVVYVELPTLSEEVTAGDVVGAVESVKSASDIKTPVTGKIVAVNSLLEKKPSVMGTSPEKSSEDGGWIAKIEVGAVGVAEWEGLMSQGKYEAFIGE